MYLLEKNNVLELDLITETITILLIKKLVENNLFGLNIEKENLINKYRERREEEEGGNQIRTKKKEGRGEGELSEGNQR